MLVEEPVTMKCLYLLWSFNANDGGNTEKPQSLPAKLPAYDLPWIQFDGVRTLQSTQRRKIIPQITSAPDKKRKDTTQWHSHPLVSLSTDRLLFTFPNTPDPPQVWPCEVWGFHSDVTEDSLLLGYDYVTRNRISRFRGNMVSPSGSIGHTPIKNEILSYDHALPRLWNFACKADVAARDAQISGAVWPKQIN